MVKTSLRDWNLSEGDLCGKLTYQLVSLGQDVLSLADVVLQDFALILADLAGPGLVFRCCGVTEGKSVETERRNAVILAQHGKMVGGRNHSKRRYRKREETKQQ